MQQKWFETPKLSYTTLDYELTRFPGYPFTRCCFVRLF